MWEQRMDLYTLQAYIHADYALNHFKHRTKRPEHPQDNSRCDSNFILCIVYALLRISTFAPEAKREMPMSVFALFVYSQRFRGKQTLECS